MAVYVFMFEVRSGPLLLVFMLVMMCDFVQETFGLLSPPPLPYSGAHQAGRSQVQDAAGGEVGELSYADGYVFSAFSSFILSVDGVIAEELVDGVC